MELKSGWSKYFDVRHNLSMYILLAKFLKRMKSEDYFINDKSEEKLYEECHTGYHWPDGGSWAPEIFIWESFAHDLSLSGRKSKREAARIANCANKKGSDKNWRSA